MKLTFQAYLLFSLVTLVHVILVAAVLPPRQMPGVSGAVPGFHLDEEGMAWLGPSGLEGGEIPVHPAGPEAEGLFQEGSGAGIETSSSRFTSDPGEPAALPDPVLDSGPLSRLPTDERVLERLSNSESAELAQEAEASSRIDMEAVPRPGSIRPLRPLPPSSVN